MVGGVGTEVERGAWAFTPGTKAVSFEAITNPTLEVVDKAADSARAHDGGATVMVDNVLATPVYSDALAQGAVVVI